MNYREVEFLRSVNSLSAEDTADVGGLMDILIQHRLSQVATDVLALPPPLIAILDELTETLGFRDREPFKELACGLLTSIQSKRCRLDTIYSNKRDLVCTLETFKPVKTPYVFPGTALLCLRGGAIHERVRDGFVTSFDIRTGDLHIANFTSEGQLIVKPGTYLLFSKFPPLMELRKQILRFQRGGTDQTSKVQVRP